MDNYLDLTKDYVKPNFLFKVEETKHKHEFQEIGEELQKVYGKAIWPLFYKIGFTEFKIRKAHEIAQKRGVTSIKYLIGIINKL